MIIIVSLDNTKAVQLGDLSICKSMSSDTYAWYIQNTNELGNTKLRFYNTKDDAVKSLNDILYQFSIAEFRSNIIHVKDVSEEE